MKRLGSDGDFALCARRRRRDIFWPRRVLRDSSPKWVVRRALLLGSRLVAQSLAWKPPNCETCCHGQLGTIYSKSDVQHHFLSVPRATQGPSACTASFPGPSREKRRRRCILAVANLPAICPQSARNLPAICPQSASVPTYKLMSPRISHLPVSPRISRSVSLAVPLGGGVRN